MPEVLLAALPALFGGAEAAALPAAAGALTAGELGAGAAAGFGAGAAEGIGGAALGAGASSALSAVPAAASGILGTGLTLSDIGTGLQAVNFGKNALEGNPLGAASSAVGVGNGIGDGSFTGLDPVRGSSSLSTAPLASSTGTVPATAPAGFLDATAGADLGHSGTEIWQSSNNDGLPAAGGTPVAGSTLSGPVASIESIPQETLHSGGLPEGAASSSTFGDVKSFLKDNKELLGVGAAGASLIPLLFGGTDASSLPGVQNATQTANNLSATGTALTGNALTGVLPSGYEDAVARSKEAGAANIRSHYANLGQSGSTAEANDLANNASQIEMRRATLLDSLLNNGMKAASAAAPINLDLAKLQLQEDAQFQAALAKLASGLMVATYPRAA